jgi:hypothetical protein
MSSLPVQNGKEHCHAVGTNCVLLEVVALPWKCVQQLSNNLNIKSTVD